MDNKPVSIKLGESWRNGDTGKLYLNGQVAENLSYDMYESLRDAGIKHEVLPEAKAETPKQK